MSDMGVEELKEYIKTMTENNQHTEARIEIAKYFRLISYQIFEKIYEITDIEGSISEHLFLYREEKTKEMFNDIKQIMINVGVNEYDAEAKVNELRRCL